MNSSDSKWLTGTWTTQKMLQVSMDYFHLERIDEALKAFTNSHWRDMKAIYDAASVRGQEALLGGVLYQQWGCAGRLMVTIRTYTREDGEIYITFVGDLTTNPDDPSDFEIAHYGGRDKIPTNGRCGLHGMLATPDQAIWMIQMVDAHWDKTLFTENKSITMV